MFVSDSTVEYSIGDFVFTRDGRNGQIVASIFDDEGDITFYELDSIPVQLFRGVDLTVFAPGEESPFVSERLPPEEEIIGFVDAAVFTLAIFTVRQEIDVLRRVVLALDTGVTRSVLEGTVQGVLATLRAERNDLAVGLGTAISDLSTQLENLESTLTTELSEISNRQQELEAETEETAGLSFLGLIRGVGAFLVSPIDFVLSRSTDFILSEVNDGLNR